MKPIETHIADTQSWHIKGSTSVRGCAFLKDCLRSASELADEFAAAPGPAERVDLTRNLNGFFALVHHSDDGLFAAVDRMRSIPLFYGRKDSTIYVSDDARWVQERVGDTQRDSLAETEFSLTGYVTGSETLYPNVRQLQAGEALIVGSADGEPTVRTERYYRFVHADFFDDAPEEICRRHEDVIDRVFRRLITWADGRPLWIPLSGGQDSRLIAMMLKHLGYSDLAAFTHGKQGSAEAKVGQRVAAALDIPWHFVAYSHEAWARWFHSQERKEYFRFADGLCSLPHIQDWPAIWELKKNETLPPEAILVPGHAGDFVAGSHLPLDILEHGSPTDDYLTRCIWKRHYSLFRWNRQHRSMSRLLRDRVLDRAEAGALETLEDVASAFEKWDWQERQAKFITNSVRVYDFWGHPWWLPLWDAELADFWCRVPLKHRVGRSLYRAHVVALYARIAEVDRQEAGTVSRGFAFSIRDALRSLGLRRVDAALRNALKRRLEYDQNRNAFYGIMPHRQFKSVYTAHEDINSFLVLDYLGRMTIEDPRDKREDG